MSYRRALLVRWSRRDRLTVLVVALTVAFLVGTVLVAVAAGGQTAAIAAEYDASGTVTYYETERAATAAAPSSGLVLPVAAVTDPDGARTYAVGVHPDTDVRIEHRQLTLGSTTRGDVATAETQRLRGDTAVTVEAVPRGPSLVPPAWYVTNTETVAELGQTGAIVLEPGDETDHAATHVPLRGALPFFLAGSDQAIGIVWLLALGGGLLVAITIYATTRMTVADRRDAIRVARATGATPRTITTLLTVRALLVGGVGVALGYAIGVITTNAAVNVAVGVGLPTSLQLQVTPAVAKILAPMLLGFLALAVLAGALAARNAVRRPPASVRPATRPTAETTPSGGPLAPLRPRLLEPRVIVPMTATLAAFVIIALVFAAAAGAVAPLADTDDATVREPDATHPVASQVPAAYGDVLRE